MKEQSENIINQFSQFLTLNPHYGYLIAAVGFAIFFLGYLFRWNWVINPEGKTRSVYVYEVLGAENMRKLMIVVTGIVVFICVGAFFLSNSNGDFLTSKL
ncbi:Imm17 family immunity protein [Pedobacter gandavensis]|uniref:Imm17 family immunity protein n=1 Tax=Pedobacter gandavensis TaxID=2679963 RepID=UPI0029303485|nr:Imm17 family immunity protein [Pedobacter gandavensis]